MNYLIRSANFTPQYNPRLTRNSFDQPLNYQDRSNEEMDWSDSCLDVNSGGVLSPILFPSHPVSTGFKPVSSGFLLNSKNSTDSTSPTSLISSLKISELSGQRKTSLSAQRAKLTFPAFYRPSSSTPKLATPSLVGMEFHSQNEIASRENSKSEESANFKQFFQKHLKMPSSHIGCGSKPSVIDDDLATFDLSNNFGPGNGDIQNAIEENFDENMASDSNRSLNERKCNTFNLGPAKPHRPSVSCLSFSVFSMFGLLLLAFVIQNVYFENTLCRIGLNTTLVREELTEKVFGQHLAIEVFMESLELFIQDGNIAQDLLVLSFQGWTGIGKNHMSNVLAQFFPKKNVHRFVVALHLTRNSMGADDLENWFLSRARSSCGIHLFVIDEMDKARMEMVSDFQTAFRSMKEHFSSRQNDGAIILLLSNTGSTTINAFTAETLEQGHPRESIVYDALIDRLEDSTRDTWYDRMVAGKFIDRTVPFLPLERRHVRKCIAASLESRGVEQSDDLIGSVLGRLTFFPPTVGAFSVTGCRKVNSELDLVLF